jgi:hypothetical protein
MLIGSKPTGEFFYSDSPFFIAKVTARLGEDDNEPLSLKY